MREGRGAGAFAYATESCECDATAKKDQDCRKERRKEGLGPMFRAYRSSEERLNPEPDSGGDEERDLPACQSSRCARFCPPYCLTEIGARGQTPAPVDCQSA